MLRTASAASRLLAAGAVVAVVHTASIVSFCWFLAQSLGAIVAGASVAEVAASLVAAAASILTRVLSQAVLDGLAVRGAATVKSQLRMRVIDAIDRGGSSLLGRTSSAHITTLIGQGLDAMDGYIGRYLPQLILTAVATPIVVVVLLMADLATGITVIVTLPLIPLFMALIGMATQSLQRRQWHALGSLAHGFLEIVQGLPTLMVFGRQHRQVARIAQVTEQYRRRTMRVLRLSFLSGFALELAASLSVAVVAVSVGVRLIDGALPLTLGLFVLVLVPEAYLPLRQVGVQFHAAAEGLDAASDVLDVLESASGVAAAAPTEAAAPAVPARAAGAPPAPARAALALHGFTVGRGDLIVVDRLSGSWMPGTVLAVTGPSGAGKSSLLGAVLGLVDHEGGLEIEGSPERASARAARIAWAGQRPELTGGPLDAVVSLGAAAPRAALVDEALAWAAADDIARDTVLGPAGEGLSGGQAQRVALARAYYRAVDRDCPIVLLDEPTSAVDAATEQTLAASFRALADRGRLVVVVTHRPALMAMADERLVLGASAMVVR